jgi:hypothetical protein
MHMRRYVPMMFGEHWIYVIAAMSSMVILALLYTLKAPIDFGIW